MNKYLQLTGPITILIVLLSCSVSEPNTEEVSSEVSLSMKMEKTPPTSFVKLERDTVFPPENMNG